MEYRYPAKRRSKFEIMIDVLRVSMDEHKPTRIMYAANLSWAPLRRILSKLEKMGLLRREGPGDDDGRTRELYFITDRGIGVLKELDKAMRAMEEFRRGESGEGGLRTLREAANEES